MRVKKIKEIIWHLETALVLSDDIHPIIYKRMQSIVVDLKKLLSVLEKQNDAQ